MPLLSRKADYALVLLSYLHHHPEGGCARVIAERFSLSPAFCANILKLLAHQGLVRSQRGKRGGYILARPAGEVPLGELLEVLGEPFRLAECNRVPEEQGCDLELICPVHGAITELHRRLLQVLQGVTLADLFTHGECSPGCTQYGLEVTLRSGAPVATNQ
jgi:Rrf2 family protein